MKKLFCTLFMMAMVTACNSSGTPKEIKSLVMMKTFFGKAGKLPAVANEKELKMYEVLSDYVEIKLTKEEEISANNFTIEGSVTAHEFKKVGGIVQGVMMMGIDKVDRVIASVDEKISKMKGYKPTSKTKNFIATYSKEDGKYKLLTMKFKK
ncbi:MAG: hypothetical protein ACPGJV_10375 [Bacteriovoracaceae bacterium]